MPRIAHAVLDSQTGDACVIRARRHTLTADEAASHGGTDTGPTPYETLVSALAACTAITLRMVAQRKGWELGAIHVEVETGLPFSSGVLSSPAAVAASTVMVVVTDGIPEVFPFCKACAADCARRATEPPSAAA